MLRMIDRRWYCHRSYDSIEGGVKETNLSLTTNHKWETIQRMINIFMRIIANWEGQRIISIRLIDCLCCLCVRIIFRFFFHSFFFSLNNFPSHINVFFALFVWVNQTICDQVRLMWYCCYCKLQLQMGFCFSDSFRTLCASLILCSIGCTLPLIYCHWHCTHLWEGELCLCYSKGENRDFTILSR